MSSFYGVPYQYEWIVVMGGINSFADACGIGANDLANSFGTVYGSKVLNKWQIVAIASVCEFSGAMLLGKAVVSTISGSITNVSFFKFNPYCLMWGFLSALFASTTWLYTATYYKLPVSTTHAIVGGILGFSLVFGGPDAVNWYTKIPDFPYMSGFVIIVLSWITSPIFSGFLSMVIYGCMKLFVLRGANAADKASWTFPILIMITFFIESFMIIIKGAGPSSIEWATDIGKVAWVSVLVGVVGAFLSCFFIPVLIRWRKEEDARVANGEERHFEKSIELDYKDKKNCLSYAWQEFWRNPYSYVEEPSKDIEKPDIRDLNTSKEFYENEMSSKVEAVAPAAGNHDLVDASLFEAYDPGAEYVFRYLQVFTAMCASFAHGSNDVSNAAGPFAGIYSVYISGFATSKVNVEPWMIALSASGIVVGLATYGRKIMELLGQDLTHITPVRGFCAELSAALVISLCSAYGMPVSTTQCITGAIIGIGLLDVPLSKMKWGLIGKIFSGWIITLVLTACLSAAVYAVGLNTPIKF